MGEKWEKLQKDPIVQDLKTVLHDGFYRFTVEDLVCLPELLGQTDDRADRPEVRQALLSVLMADNPAKSLEAADLSEKTQFNLLLFRIPERVKESLLGGARAAAGAVRGVSADAVRKAPSKRQPRGGHEWQLILELRQQIIQDALAAGRELPDDLVQTADIRSDKPPSPPNQSKANNAATREDPQDLYKEIYEEIKGSDFDKNFFQRKSTAKCIERLAEGAEKYPVTFYVGRSFAADITAPLSDQLMVDSLKERFGQFRGSEGKLSDDEPGLVKRVVDALQGVLPPEYLASMARETGRRHKKGDQETDDPNAETGFKQDFLSGISRGRDPGEFLTLSIGLLAFVLRKRLDSIGRDSAHIQVVTTNYHDRITTEADDVRERFEELDLDEYKLKPRGPSNFGNKVKPKEVPVYSLNGIASKDPISAKIKDPFVIGEADRFVQYDNNLDMMATRRNKLLESMLGNSLCIFVGSRLNNPDIIEKLAKTKYQKPRYAIIQSPDLVFTDPKGKKVPLTKDEKAEALNLLAQRYLHLDVIPIIIDFSHQAPQLLIEVALRLYYGEDGYEGRSYQDRLKKWWATYEDAAYFPEDGTQPGTGKRDEATQRAWREGLEEVRSKIIEHDDIIADEEQLQVRVDVWLRNPDRTLRMWATSDGLWLNAYSAPSCSIPDGESAEMQAEHAIQKAFRSGKVVDAPVEPPGRIWKHQLCIPLVLFGEPWHHLPIGVARIVSSANILPEKSKTGASFNRRRERVASYINDEIGTLFYPRPSIKLS